MGTRTPRLVSASISRRSSYLLSPAALALLFSIGTLSCVAGNSLGGVFAQATDMTAKMAATILIQQSLGAARPFDDTHRLGEMGARPVDVVDSIHQVVHLRTGRLQILFTFLVRGECRGVARGLLLQV